MLHQIPMPNPMHPILQRFLHLIQIPPHAPLPHRCQCSRFPCRAHDALRPYPARLIVRQERVGDVGWAADLFEQGGENAGVFEGLSGALGLHGDGGVGGVAHDCNAAFGEEGGGAAVEAGPGAERGQVEELEVGRSMRPKGRSVMGGEQGGNNLL